MEGVTLSVCHYLPSGVYAECKKQHSTTARTLRPQYRLNRKELCVSNSLFRGLRLRFWVLWRPTRRPQAAVWPADVIFFDQALISPCFLISSRRVPPSISRATRWPRAAWRRRTRCRARGFTRVRTCARPRAPAWRALPVHGRALTYPSSPHPPRLGRHAAPTAGRSRVWVRPPMTVAYYPRPRYRPSEGVEPSSAEP